MLLPTRYIGWHVHTSPHATLLNTGEPMRAEVQQLPSKFRQGPCLHLSGLPADGLHSQYAVIRLDVAPGLLP